MIESSDAEIPIQNGSQNGCVKKSLFVFVFNLIKGWLQEEFRYESVNREAMGAIV